MTVVIQLWAVPIELQCSFKYAQPAALVSSLHIKLILFWSSCFKGDKMSTSLNGMLNVNVSLCSCTVTARKPQNAHDALKLEEGNIFYSSHGLLEHPLKQPPSLFVGDGRIITIHISLSFLHLSTAVADKANRDKTHSYNKWLLLDVSVGVKK